LAAKVKFDFKESQQFRIVHVDGAFGGPTPGGSLYLSLFNERHAMPDRVVHAIEGFQVGAEIVDERVASDAITRTNEVGVIMSFDSAKVLRDWLTRQIDDMEKRVAAAKVDTSKDTKH
jgi:hypothetical protein